MVAQKWQEFVVKKPKVKEFETCRAALDPTLYRVDGSGNIHVKLRWELLVLFGTRAQLTSYDKFRIAFVDGLLKEYCTPFLDCETQIIGSRSPKSDIDINMTCAEHMEQVLNGILMAHEKAFPGASMEEVFDVNIYGSVFHYLDARCDIAGATTCYPRYEIGYKQRMWSFLRIVEYCEKLSKVERETLLMSWPKPYQILYAKTKELNKRFRKRKETSYVAAITKYLSELKKRKPDPHMIAEKFSMSKVFENDTYRSVGAVLHIVEQKKNILASSLYDSAYDNMGFIFQVMLKKSLCGDGSIFVKHVKIAKYITRVYDAVYRINAGKVSTEFQKLNEHAEKVNAMRKALTPLKEMKGDVDAMLDAMNLKPNEAPAVSTLAGFCGLVFSEIKKDKEIYEKAT